MWLILPTSCIKNKQESDTPKESKIELDSNFVKSVRLTPYETLVNSYSDSINNAKNENQLPVFLKERNIDFYSMEIWGDSIDKISIRYNVIQNVTNCHSLKLIIDATGNYYKIAPDNFEASQLHSTESVVDIVKARYQQLNCN